MKIIETAQSYLGESEIPGNNGFESASFEKKMKSVGWRKGLPWCAFFAKLVWKESGEDVHPFSGNSYQTLLNFQKSGYKTGYTPKEGALIIYRRKRNGKFRKSGDSFLGHVGIVTKIESTGKLRTIDGNTGDKVKSVDVYPATVTNDGLELAGYVYPKQVLVELPKNKKIVNLLKEIIEILEEE